MSGPLVNLESIKEVESVIRNKSSKCDSILDSFIISNDQVVEVHVEDKNAIYLRDKIEKRIRERYLEDIINISVVDDVVILKK